MNQLNEGNDKRTERRSAAQFEIRQDDKAVRVVGHAAVFNQETVIADFFREMIAPGAFSEAIRNDDVPFLIEHSDLPLARNTSGTLKLSEDSVGLRVESELDPEDPDVRRIMPKMQRGDLDKMSFAFRAIKQEWVEEEGKLPLRIIRQAKLFDVSIVTQPAYAGTDIAMRSLDEKREAERKASEEEKERSRQNFAAAASRIRKIKEHELTQRAKKLARVIAGRK